MLNVFSNIAKSVLTSKNEKTNPPLRESDKVESEQVLVTKVLNDMPKLYSLDPFILDYLKSDQWHTVRDYINTWLIRYQVDVHDKLLRASETGKGEGIMSLFSGKVIAADEFRLFLIRMVKEIEGELNMVKGRK